MHFSPFPWGELLAWYTKHGRHDLEWRDYTKEPDLCLYCVWLSEIFLQQTQVERVRGYFRKILEAYPSVHHLAQASYEEFFPYYQGMGYYSRARNLLKTAGIVSTQYDGKFPKDKSLLQKLPGVGEYTSSALLAFGYGEGFLAWDTNLEKVFSRYYTWSRTQKLSLSEKNDIENDFRDFISKNPTKSLARDINNALMDFASIVDRKSLQSIDWENYPIRSGVFYDTRGTMEPQEIKKSQSFPTPDATILLTLHKDHKEYYSTNRETYEPFQIPPWLSRNSREYIQKVFRERYNLELSVRPAHKKYLSELGTPFIEMNAQIQSGKHSFTLYEKKGGFFVKKSQEE
jgi:A/G-specific adenine glycosylase